MPTSQSIQFLQLTRENDLAILLAIFNSNLFDSLVRLKLGGIDLTQAVIRQIPVPPKERYARVIKFSGTAATLSDHLLSRVAPLLAEDARMDGFCQAIQPKNGNIQNSEDRQLLIREIDDLVKIAYNQSDVGNCYPSSLS